MGPPSLTPETMGNSFRLLDTGVRSAAENMALDEVLLACRAADESPDTLRFLQLSPPAVLVGYHQSVPEEVRLDFCRENGIDVNRRITGGGAIFFDESQLGWELIATNRGRFGSYRTEALTGFIAGAVIGGLKEGLGIEATFRPRNDIEAGGRKFSGTGGAWNGDAFLFQGTLLVDFDADCMLRALRVPVEKLKAREVESLKERVTCLRELLGAVPPLDAIKRCIARGVAEALGVELVPAGLNEAEERLLKATLPRFISQGWGKRVTKPGGALRGCHSSKSGLVRVDIALTPSRKSIQNAYITGDIFCRPGRALYDLEAALKGCRLDEERIAGIVEEFFRSGRMSIAYGGAGEVMEAFRSALARHRLLGRGFTLEEANGIRSVVLPFEEVVKRPLSLILMPYCAKGTACGYRREKECPSCGECTVGAVYDRARRLGCAVATIVSFEDLESTLADARRSGADAFVGSCCEAFTNRHEEDFRRLGVPGILVDIDSATCYELGKSRSAYKGDFEHQTHLKVALIDKVLAMFEEVSCASASTSS